MATSNVVVLLSLCLVALATGKPAADTSLNLVSTVEQQTKAANIALAALPVACTHGSARSIQEAKTKVFGDVASCSVSSIVKDIAYILIDGADFGSAVWDDGVKIVYGIRACNKEKSFLKVVECLDNYLPDFGSTVQSINVAIRHLVEQLIAVITDIKVQIKTCQGKSTREYQIFLDSLVEKAMAC